MHVVLITLSQLRLSKLQVLIDFEEIFFWGRSQKVVF